ncbi:isocitrate lyase/phosphoenolpyruvate mutase family protein, partial [Asanoa sp. NPDC050611]|uniref:isocitrate lyase/PEP mutase family protein n=1 Tax=Asanoa sp. NPDC050611 TaxID=3157098 RepID=UPI0033CE524D
MTDFRSLHHRPGQPLVLPNAWDVASARIIEKAGAAAIATTSAGVAWGLGTEDDGGLGQQEALDVIARIVAAVGVPVTADVEAGYGDVEGTIRMVREAGAVGVNLEDGTAPTAEHTERIRTARQVGGPELFVNARIDTYLRQLGDPETRLTETLDRAAAYVAAGADGVFVPGVTDAATIATLAKELTVPLNIMAGLD